MNEIRRKFSFSFVVMLLALGLFVSCIGVTLCRYEVTYKEDVPFKIKGMGNYYIQSEQQEWIFNNETQVLSLDFEVSNAIERNIPETTHLFFVRLKSDVELDVSMIIISESGREIRYKNQQIVDEDGMYEYRFVDENLKEPYFELEGNQLSTQNIKLEVLNTTDAFLSEVIIVDRAYEIESQTDYVTSQAYPLVVTSNYLSETENLKILVNDMVKLTLTSNQSLSSKIIYETSNDNLNVVLSEQEINLEANKEHVSLLSIIPMGEISENDSVSVTWQLYNASNEIIKELSADFIVSNTLERDIITPTIIEVNSINGDSFSKFKPIKLEFQSDVACDLKLSEFPQGTRYSIDNGDSWYVLTEKASIYTNLDANLSNIMIIDLRYATIKWEDQKYILSLLDLNDNLIDTIELDMIADNYIPLDIINSHMGVINAQDISFETNITEYETIYEMLVDNQYKKINVISNYFDIETLENITTIKLKEETEVPAGTYRISLIQKVNDILLSKEQLHFFVIEKEELQVEEQPDVSMEVQV